MDLRVFLGVPTHPGRAQRLFRLIADPSQTPIFSLCPPPMQIRNVGTGLCVDTKHGASGSPLKMENCVQGLGEAAWSSMQVRPGTHPTQTSDPGQGFWELPGHLKEAIKHPVPQGRSQMASQLCILLEAHGQPRVFRKGSWLWPVSVLLQAESHWTDTAYAQVFTLTWREDIRPGDPQHTKKLCLDAVSHTSPVTLYDCHTMKGNQLWKYRSVRGLWRCVGDLPGHSCVGPKVQGCACQGLTTELM